MDALHYRWGRATNLAVSTTSALSGVAHIATCKRRRIYSTVPCWITVGPAPTTGNLTAAYQTGTYLPAGVVEIIAVSPGDYVAAVVDEPAGSAVTGILNITDLAR